MGERVDWVERKMKRRQKERSTNMVSFRIMDLVVEGREAR